MAKDHKDDSNETETPESDSEKKIKARSEAITHVDKESDKAEKSGGTAGAPDENEDSQVSAKENTEPNDESEEDELPTHMGFRRYVYATFFGLAICLAYVFSKMGMSGWHKLSQWTPKVGEPREDWVTPVSAVLSGVLVFVLYRRPKVNTFADEVALELSKVDWPTKDKVQRFTSIVVISSLVSSFLFWVYDIVANRGITAVTASNHPILYGLLAGLGIYLIRALGIKFLVGKA